MDDNQNQNQDNMTAQPQPAPAPAAPPAPEPTLTPEPEQPQPTPDSQPAPATESATPPAKPKAPMDPKTKKTIILLCAIGGGVVVLAILAIIFLPMIFKVNYSETYRAAKELKEKMNALSYNSDCDNVVSYYDSAYVTTKSYNGYAESCLAATSGLDELVNKLGQTSGIRRDGNLNEKYDAFKTTFDKLSIESDSLAAKLEVYKTWHAFQVAIDDLSPLSNDSSFNAAASILTETDNKDLKEYGTKWLESILDYARAYRAYYNASYSDKNYSEKRQVARDKETAYENFVDAQEPDIKTLAPINMENISAASTRFNDLYNAITKTYAENYDKNSGDCSELFGVVYCD